MHPTPAVGGLPSKSALEFIHKCENYDRSFYTGFLGPFKKAINLDLFVNLRCGKIKDDLLTVYAGAGITAQSDPIKEWEEICRKATTFLSVI